MGGLGCEQASKTTRLYKQKNTKMTSIVFPDLPIEAFYYSQQASESGEWTLGKAENERLSNLPTSSSWVVWPPILSSDCTSTWLATRKAKAEEKEKRDDSLRKWLVPYSTEAETNKVDYVAAIREGVEKSMDAFANCLRESIQVDVEQEEESNKHLNSWLVASSSSSPVAKEIIEQISPWLTAPGSGQTGVKKDPHLDPWLVSPSPSSSPSSSVVEGVNKFLVELSLDNNTSARSSTSSRQDAKNGVWLSMSDSGRAESVISDAMKMDTEDDELKPILSEWLAVESRDVYTYDGVDSEASIEIIDQTFDFETMEEI